MLFFRCCKFIFEEIDRKLTKKLFKPSVLVFFYSDVIRNLAMRIKKCSETERLSSTEHKTWGYNAMHGKYFLFQHHA